MSILKEFVVHSPQIEHIKGITTMESLSELKHLERAIQSGGTVLVLNTGGSITPPAQAMLAALHSRSIGGIRSHLQVVEKRGSDGFMKTYYVQYGHKSIGDLGSITLFIEGVSMLAAKAIQDSRLYNGQEASTRYIDFSEQPFIDPVGSEASQNVLEQQRKFYLTGLTALKPFLAEQFPLEEGANEKMHAKALEARAFDIMRSFLPAGASTNLAWHGPLRVIGDRLPELRNHPLKEVREAAKATHEALYAAFPDSFPEPGKVYEDTEAYVGSYMESYYYDNPNTPEFRLTRNTVLLDGISAEEKRVLSSRPNGKTELPKWLEDLGHVRFEFLLDFGSFRDAQRHRAVIQRMPLLSTAHGFEPWYLEQMPERLKKAAQEHLKIFEKDLADLFVDPEVAQYFIPMGYRCANRITGGLPAVLYFIELRAQSTVHPTLRIRAQQMGSAIKETFGDTVALYYDDSPDHFDIARGGQDIIVREEP